MLIGFWNFTVCPTENSDIYRAYSLDPTVHATTVAPKISSLNFFISIFTLFNSRLETLEKILFGEFCSKLNPNGKGANNGPFGACWACSFHEVLKSCFDRFYPTRLILPFLSTSRASNPNQTSIGARADNPSLTEAVCDCFVVFSRF